MLKLLNHGTKRVIQKGEWFIQEDKHGDRWPLGSTEHPHSKKLISSQQVLHRREQGCVTERQTGPQDILAESPTHQNISLDSGLDSPKYPHIFWSVRELDATNRACDTLVHAQPVGDTNTPCKDEEHLRVYTVISKHWSPLSNIISLYKSKWMIVDRKDISQQRIIPYIIQVLYANWKSSKSNFMNSTPHHLKAQDKTVIQQMFELFCT